MCASRAVLIALGRLVALSGPRSRNPTVVEGSLGVRSVMDSTATRWRRRDLVAGNPLGLPARLKHVLSEFALPHRNQHARSESLGRSLARRLVGGLTRSFTVYLGGRSTTFSST